MVNTSEWVWHHSHFSQAAVAGKGPWLCWLPLAWHAAPDPHGTHPERCQRLLKLTSCPPRIIVVKGEGMNDAGPVQVPGSSCLTSSANTWAPRWRQRRCHRGSPAPSAVQSRSARRGHPPAGARSRPRCPAGPRTRDPTRSGRRPGACAMSRRGARRGSTGSSAQGSRRDTTTPGGKLIFHLFGALAVFEHGLIRSERLLGWRRPGFVAVVADDRHARCRSAVLPRRLTGVLRLADAKVVHNAFVEVRYRLRRHGQQASA